jgi:hypothetical protein
VEIQEKTLNTSASREVPKKELQQTYNQLERLNVKQIRKVLTQGFFFTDGSRAHYDSLKLQLFNIFYSGGDEAKKTQFLFQLMSSSQSGCITNRSQDLIEVLINMVEITCLVMSNGLVKSMGDDIEIFEKEVDEILFDELLTLYSSNPLIRRDFAEYINDTLLFPASLQPKEPLPISSRRSRSAAKYGSNRSNYTSRARFITLKDF